ncbi:hypothetical protein LDENG_00176080 [Lucifuga dentata]|nr:hypothetical protein LDENG_00176080 [Lucifuga dentata]
MPGSCHSPPLIVSACADDVNVLVRGQRDIEGLRDSLRLYERASSAKVKWGQSEAFQVGQWEEEAVPALPGGLQWGNRGLQVLGVYLDTEGYQQQNWEGVREKVCAKLSKWKWLLPQLSYRGRVLVTSTLWHRLTVLSPPRGFIEDIQRTLVDFLWSGHWISASALYLPVEEGGQGLMDISAQVMAFRLQTAQRMLYHLGVRRLETAGFSC